ncbi:MAG TPA: hypothetical protein VFL86_11900, partial [Burkholderiaceae bacterium]|nr:hypothetical protein [Burkholderiaceae bacterium]
MTFFKWIATAAAAVALLGCGGQDGEAVSVAAPVTVKVETVPAGLRVTASLVNGFGALPEVLETTQYTFNAKFTSGPDAGQQLSGLLLLQARSFDIKGRFQVRGSLVGTAGLAAGTGSLATFEKNAISLRTTLRARIEAANTDLLAATKADAAAGLSDTDHLRSLNRFASTFAALATTYQTDVAAMKVQLLANSAGGESAPPDADIPLLGTANDRGDISLELGDEPLKVEGTAAADGSMSGTLGGTTGLIGTWTATPQPMPAAATLGRVADGLAKYGTYCANCHTAVVRRN